MAIADTLLIDDSEPFSSSVRNAFEAAGMPIDCSDSWETGAKLFRVGLHELVIADYNLPGSRHGLKLLATIKRLRPSSKLVLISGALTSRAVEIASRTRLVDEYLEKTSSLAERLLELGREASAAARTSTQWRDIAAAHLSAETIFDKDIDEIDALLKGEMRNS